MIWINGRLTIKHTTLLEFNMPRIFTTNQP